MPDEMFHAPILKMEEEEDGGDEERGIGFLAMPGADGAPERVVANRELIARLIEERQRIMADTSLKTRDKLKLLESNHRTTLMLRGGTFKSFKTEQVVYAILIFNALLLIVLALLNVFARLPVEVTLAFVGTALGGTIATIAQKLGRL